ncbi:MAG: hypothetical protein KGZ56_03365 [Dethiobacter sp.]|nr:hypothetical protein [Dethiobacter sp.]MBS3899737.1 hypothetical protein [Dethiobacter sp.]
MKKLAMLRSLAVFLAFSLVILPPMAAAYTGPFRYQHVFENLPPRISMNWGSPTPTFRGITSKWNEPRDVGTNPHPGIDVDTVSGLALLAVWCGWLQAPSLGSNAMGVDFTKRLDLNQNRIVDDPPMFINYYHANSVFSPGYYQRGHQIGTTGQSHIHWGGTAAGPYNTRWFRNEIHYRWLAEDVWRAGRDVDTFSRVSWNNNVARVTAYFRTTQLTSPPPAEVRIFHRRSGTNNAWTDGGSMTAEPGNVFAFNFTGRYPANTNVDWLVRIMRGGLATNIYPWAWAPARFDWPNSNPNAATTQQRPFYTNTIN